jgi:hypothetical protein
MKKYWNTLFGLDYERSIWVGQDDLGTEKAITLNHKQYRVTIPQTINKHVILRLRGFGKTRDNQTGDLFLHVWLNKGEDINQSLWLSEASAKNGVHKVLLSGEKKLIVVVPPKSYNGLTIRAKGLGQSPDFNWRAPFLDRKRGNLLVKLFVYPDTVTPNYGSFETLSTENMALEGWVYQKIDDVIHKIGKSSFLVNPIRADTIADLFNERGWRGIFHALVVHLKLTHLNIELIKSDSISLPGSCQKFVTYQNNVSVSHKYTITIKEQLLDHPFFIAAIMAHELCHVIYSERIADNPTSVGYGTQAGKVSLEEERAVDLLVFMYKIGEFQLRVARDKRLTLGYFNQEVFERMQGIVSRKLNKF